MSIREKTFWLRAPEVFILAGANLTRRRQQRRGLLRGSRAIIINKR